MSENHKLERILAEIGCESVPPDVRQLAEEITDEFRRGLAERPVAADSMQSSVRLVPDVPTDQADGDSRETRPNERPPGRRHVSRRFIAMFQHRRVRWFAVAAVAAAIVLAIGLWPGKRGTAWAFEQAIQALQDIRTIHVVGVLNSNPFEAWSTSRDGTREDEAFMDIGGGKAIRVKHEGVVYSYESARNTVYIENGDAMQVMDPWLGADFFKDMKTKATQWEESEGIDNATGRACVFVKGVAKNGSAWVQFDTETKLPIRAKCWNNHSWEGSPLLDWKQIDYNLAIPDDKFHFAIPPGAKVIDQRNETRKDQDTK